MQPILASASSGRLAVLRAAGLDPVVRVSGVDEDALIATLGDAGPRAVVAGLARAKAEAVAGAAGHEYPEAVVLGCDSMLEVAGASGPELVGKPHRTEVARELWRRTAGSSARLLTGHCAVAVRAGAAAGTAVGTEATTVRFGTPDAAELEAYLDSGEPLQVAGGFTLDGLGGWFVDGVDGVPSAVIGISLPLTRSLLAELGIGVTTLWRR